MQFSFQQLRLLQCCASIVNTLLLPARRHSYRQLLLRLKPRRAMGKRKGEGGRLCSVRLRVLRQTTSGEHKFKLMSLLLGGHDASDLQTFSMRVAAQAAETDASRRGSGRRGRRGKKGPVES